MAPLSAADLEKLPSNFVQATESIRSRLPENLQSPKWAVICGSGLSGLVDHIEERVLIDYSTIPVCTSPRTVRLSL